MHLKRWHIDSSCSLFNVKPRPNSLSFNTRFKTFRYCLCPTRTNKKYFAQKFVTCQSFRLRCTNQQPRFCKKRGSSCKRSLSLMPQHFRAASSSFEQEHLLHMLQAKESGQKMKPHLCLRVLTIT